MINISDACKKLARVELQNGNIVKVFPDLSCNDEKITEYNLVTNNATGETGTVYKIDRDCSCYTLDGEKIKLSEVKGFGNNFYELINGNDLKLFINIHGFGDGSTWRLFNNNAKVESIDLTNITSLPAYTLFQCKSLREIEISSGMTEIDTYAIAACDGLQSLRVNENNPKFSSKNSQGEECNCILEQQNDKLVLIQGCNVSTIPDNITDIASGAFDECEGIHSVTFHPQLKRIGDNVFRKSGLNAKVTLPNTIDSVGKETFKECGGLKNVECNIKNISEQLFKNCNSLSGVTLNNTETIGKQSFMGCSSLHNITLPDTLTQISASTFANSGLLAIDTNHIGRIPSNAFAGCSGLTSITFNNTYTTSIDQNAFQGCINLLDLTISENITDIAINAFSDCNNLTNLYWNSINYTGTTTPFINYATLFETVTFGNNVVSIPQALCKNMSITSVMIPDNVESIGYDCFYGCSALREVTIGENNSSLSEIPDSCFEGCTSLETVYINSDTKIDLVDPAAFANCDNLTEIVVPDDLLAEYKESEDWYEYRDIIFGQSIFTITFDSLSGETTPSTQYVRCGAYIENPGTVHKDLYEFEYWEDEDGNEWDFDVDYVIGNMTLYAHYREVKAIMVKSISTGVTYISMSSQGSYPANVEYSYDGINWYNIWNSGGLAISTSEGYSEYVYFRGYNPDGFSRGSYNNCTNFYIYDGECNVLGNVMYLKDYNQEVTNMGNYEFYGLFKNSNAIVDASKLLLSPTTLAPYCYFDMFNNCTSLKTAPELPATNLAFNCYGSMFAGCTSLETAPELPATTLTDECYAYMFRGCTSLTTAPELSATTLTDECYAYMFRGCTSLTTAPELPATNLAFNCYGSMFAGCTSLETAPELPATTMANYCYQGMFYNCTSLTTAPELPATNLANSYYCYVSMFQGCTSLTTAPVLPATTLANSCYEGMFQGCTSLTTAPELPATTLANYCYYYMFQGCTSLVTAPELPATTLTESCYNSMFQGCTKLNYIKCLAVNGINKNSSTNYWLYRTANSGTFIKHPSATWPSGNNGKPSNWTVEDAVLE